MPNRLSPLPTAHPHESGEPARMSVAKLRTLLKKLDARFHRYERGVGGLGDPKKHPNLNNSSSPNSAHTCACRYPLQRFVFCTDSPKIDPCIRRGERGVWGFGKIKYFYLSVSIPPLSAHSRAGGNPSWISNWIPACAGMSGVLCCEKSWECSL